MAEQLQIVAQRTMDLFYQSYKSSSQFFDLDDFVFYAGATISDIYQQEARLQYNENRALKQETVVSFPADWLLEQELEVERKNNETFSELVEPVMSFTFDNQVVGVQEILPVNPSSIIFERTTQAAAWQKRLLPFTHRTFWYSIGNKIIFFNKGGCNVSKVKVLYVPGRSNTMLIPEGIISMAMNQTIATVRQAAQGVIEKKSIDGQGQNKTIETEMNKMALKQ